MKKVSFDEYKNPIPYALIPLTLQECEQEFVLQLNDTNIRRKRWQEFERYNADLNACLSHPLKQWMDGSFTTLKPNPSDIDVVNFIDISDLDDHLALFDMNHSVGETKRKYNIDGYIVVVVPADHEHYDTIQKHIDYWRKWFGRDRNANPKGLIEITHD